jgi:hypothetical protein
VDGTSDINITFRLGEYTAAGAFVKYLANAGALVETLPADGSWVDAVAPAEATVATTGNTVRMMLYNSGAAPPAGTQIEVTDSLVQKVSAIGDSAPAFFRGDTPDAPTEMYAWSGAADASTSVATGRSETTATTAIVERRVDGDDWVKLYDGVILPTDVVDPVPSTQKTNEYRVTSVSTAPSYRVNDSVFVTPDNGVSPDAGPDIQWVFLNYGDAFEKLLRFRTEPEIEEQVSRTKATRSLLGRRKPILLLGQNRSREVSVSGRLVHDSAHLEDKDYDSPPDDWADAGLDAEIVCYRDFTGRRVFGALSDVKASDVRPGVGTVGFSVTESDYTEKYGVIGTEAV